MKRTKEKHGEIRLRKCVLKRIAALLAVIILASAVFSGSASIFAVDEDESKTPSMAVVDFYSENLAAAGAYNFELRPQNGDTIPFGKGRNYDCYYPQGCGQQRPEVYVWDSATLSVADPFLKIVPKKPRVSFTFDTFKQNMYFDYGKPYFTLVLKSNKTFSSYITVKTLNSVYQKTWYVKFTGDWQKIILDFAEVDGWTKKDENGEYVPSDVTPFCTEINKLYGGMAFNLPGSGSCSEFLVDYIAMFPTLEGAEEFESIGSVTVKDTAVGLLSDEKDPPMPEVDLYKQKLDAAGAYNFELRPQFGNEIPFGRGRNYDCYYPQGSEHTRPEIYPWGSAEVSVSDKFVKIVPKLKNVSITFDSFPATWLMDYAKPYFTMVLKTDRAFEGTIRIKTLDGRYQKTWNVTFTGDWQKIILDFADTNGWEQKGDDGLYIPVAVTPFCAEINKLYGGFAFAVPGTEKCSEYVFDYIAMFPTLDAAEKFDGIGITDVKNTSIGTVGELKLSILSAKYRDLIVFMRGYSDGTFRPNMAMTRAEVCAAIARLMATEQKIAETKTSAYPDIKDTDWYASYVAFLEKEGVLDEFTGEFHPNNSITRAEFVGLLFAARGFVEAVNTPDGFSDVGETTKFAKAIYSASSAGVVSGYADGTFKPDKALSRAEIAVILSRLLDIKPMNDEKQMFSDLDKSFWGYGEIMAVVIPNPLKIDTEKTKTVLAEVDEKAKALKKSIVETKTEVVVKGTKYYVSADGNDENDGKSPEKAWKSIAKVSEVAFENGDGVFFKRGDTFRGRLLLKNGVTYSAYGEGAKPILTASPENIANPDKWELYDAENNIWCLKEKVLDQGTLIFDDSEYAIKLIPSFKGGKFVNDAGEEFKPSAELKNDLEMFCETNENLKANGVPNVTVSKGRLYLKCDRGNPGSVFKSIELMPPTSIMVAGTEDYMLTDVTIDNLSLKYTGAHGIHAQRGTNYHIQNCEFRFIGGGIQSYDVYANNIGAAVRYGNGVEIGDCDGYYIQNCCFSDIYDTAMTFQSSDGRNDRTIKDIYFEGNLIENCVYSVECFWGSAKTEGVDRYVENFFIRNNIMRNAGSGFGSTRPNKQEVAHIKTWNAYNKVKDKTFIIENNIFDRSSYMMFHTCVRDAENLDSAPVFRNNTFIQYISSDDNTASLGKFGKITVAQPYNADIPTTLKMFGISEENGNEFLFAE